MIRNVVVGRLRPEVSPEQIEPALQALREMTVEGVDLRLVCGVDLGLREGTASFAITVDLADADAYRRYEADPGHNRIRSELIAPLVERTERVVFQLPSA
jgi:hypothetical protein